jgi:hypothetical protein
MKWSTSPVTEVAHIGRIPCPKSPSPGRPGLGGRFDETTPRTAPYKESP